MAGEMAENLVAMISDKPEQTVWSEKEKDTVNEPVYW